MEHAVIVGAGVMGCACALRLLQRGWRVTLLERAVPGAESSASAAGILGAQSEVASAGPFLELCLASRSRFRHYAQELAELSHVSIDYETSGVLEVAMDAGEGRLVAARAAWMLDRGLRVEVLDRDQACRLEPGLNPQIIGANYYPDDHQVDPDRLSRALAVAVSRLGGMFRGGTVTGLARGQGCVTGVHVDHELIAADAVIIAAGAWSSRLAGVPPLRTEVKPLAGQIVQLEQRPAQMRHVIYSCQGYVVPRTDGRVLLGSTLEERGYDKAVTLDGVRRITTMAADLVPGLRQARWITAWSGLRPATGDGLPLLGPTSLPGLFMATGHFRNGILLTPATGDIMAALVQQQPLPEDLPSLKAFSPLPVTVATGENHHG
ncbi:MAG: glycine oxidase ThiO [Magnetococcales bacterium]|nr:glycine oxidase ThiO [Magnetococcales bacterium]